MAPPGANDVFSIDDQHVVIVGGTAGIGLAVASHFVTAGAKVVITGRRPEGAELAGSIGASFVAMDVADEESVAAGFDAIAADVERIDCLILNAGIEGGHGEIGEVDLDIFGHVLDVNTMGVVRAMAHGVKHLVAQSSVIVTSSPAGSVTAPGMAAYSASKAALDMLVRTWALELGPQQIRVNAVLPGIVESEMASESSPDLELIRRMTANGIYRKAEELAPVFHFLASPASATLTGSHVGAHDGIPAGFSHEVLGYLAADLQA